MKETFVEQKKVLRLACYKEHKFAPPQGAPIDVVARARARQACDFGFTEIMPACKNCVWFKIFQVGAPDGSPLITDRVIDRSDVSSLAVEYRTAPPLEVLPVEQIAEEKNGVH